MRLEFIGQPGPHRDPERYRLKLKAARPELTEIQIEKIMHRENAKFRPRMKRSDWTVFGADILSTDIESMESWPYLNARWKSDLRRFPIEGGVVVPTDKPQLLQRAIFDNRQNEVNRLSLIVPAGISKTYVWTDANGWIQNVEDRDIALIKANRFLALCFRSADQADNIVKPRYFERVARERLIFQNTKEWAEFEADKERKNQWLGR